MLIFQLYDLICRILSLSGKTGEVLDTKYFDMWGGGMCDLPCAPAAAAEPIAERTNYGTVCISILFCSILLHAGHI